MVRYFDIRKNVFTFVLIVFFNLTFHICLARNEYFTGTDKNPYGTIDCSQALNDLKISGIPNNINFNLLQYGQIYEKFRNDLDYVHCFGTFSGNQLDQGFGEKYDDPSFFTGIYTFPYENCYLSYYSMPPASTEIDTSNNAEKGGYFVDFEYNINNVYCGFTDFDNNNQKWRNLYFYYYFYTYGIRYLIGRPEGSGTGRICDDNYYEDTSFIVMDRQNGGNFVRHLITDSPWKVMVSCKSGTIQQPLPASLYSFKIYDRSTDKLITYEQSLNVTFAYSLLVPTENTGGNVVDLKKIIRTMLNSTEKKHVSVAMGDFSMNGSSIPTAISEVYVAAVGFDLDKMPELSDTLVNYDSDETTNTLGDYFPAIYNVTSLGITDSDGICNYDFNNNNIYPILVSMSDLYKFGSNVHGRVVSTYRYNYKGQSSVKIYGNLNPDISNYNTLNYTLNGDSFPRFRFLRGAYLNGGGNDSVQTNFMVVTRADYGLNLTTPFYLYLCPLAGLNSIPNQDDKFDIPVLSGKTNSLIELSDGSLYAAIGDTDPKAEEIDANIFKKVNVFPVNFTFVNSDDKNFKSVIQSNSWGGVKCTFPTILSDCLYKIAENYGFYKMLSFQYQHRDIKNGSYVLSDVIYIKPTMEIQIITRHLYYDCFNPVWSDWSECTESCGSKGTQTRDNSSPFDDSYGSISCGIEMQDCNRHVCTFVIVGAVVGGIAGIALIVGIGVGSYMYVRHRRMATASDAAWESSEGIIRKDDLYDITMSDM